MPFVNNLYIPTVSRNMCIGCGVCAGVCPAKNLEMRDGSQFGYVPMEKGNCVDSCSVCSDVCPFIDHDENEDTLSERLYARVPGIAHTQETGYYLNSYVGYVNNSEQRWRGTSGGIARWFLCQLLKSDVVDNVICVVTGGNSKRLFSFKVLSNPQDVIGSSRSAYYPVELSEAVQRVIERPERYAVIGLPCFIKAIRLASLRNRKLRDRILVCAGLTCGQLCSKAFTENLIRKMGCNLRDVVEICYRDKAEGKPPGYDVLIRDKHDAQIRFSNLKYFCGLWPMSALRPCLYCDDIFAETADIAFMDAWLPEYEHESAGTNLVITRSQIAESILHDSGVQTDKLNMEQIPIEKVIMSQQGAIRIKRKILAYRLWLSKSEQVPSKRVVPQRPGFFERLECMLREHSREKLVRASHTQCEAGDVGTDIIDKRMRRYISLNKILRAFLKAKQTLKI